MTSIDVPTTLRILCEAAGEDEDLELAGDDSETTLADLGFDSLVLIEAGTRIEREFGAAIPEDRLAGAVTVADFRALVNEVLADAPIA
ncbi:acyl carrier protein [Amycolatopsis acidicola]|uniref:Acyl carrier protein n=1 Tax=Amycolatopsis acidicola TaxID=2596893 RepID=A0A5N0VNY8_9PSEU|nr:acyl carrier protein [Amycolatopsis acidicola]KAA9166512.1 acyl carrier protein [Amycolatopsis acidicola]